MKTLKLTILAASIATLISLTACNNEKDTNSTSVTTTSGVHASTLPTMRLSSPTVSNGQSLTKAQVFNLWGCKGENISPALAWADVPKGTQSFAVTMYDPDAATVGGWWHWMMINIPANIALIPTDSGNKNNKNLPDGAEHVKNDFGYKGFGGACPPVNAQPHNYTITVYALNVKTLNFPRDVLPAVAYSKIQKHVIGSAKFIAPTDLR